MTDNRHALGDGEPAGGSSAAGAQVRSGLASFAQEQLWLVDQAMPGTGVHNVARVWDLFGPLDTGRLRDCADRLVARNELLRTALLQDGGVLRQYIQPVGSACFVELAADDVDMAAKMLEEHIAAPFDLAAGSVFRAILIRLGADRHVFAIVVHHIACDGLSHVMIRDELIRLYAAADSDDLGIPDAEPGSHIHFANWERAEWAAGAAAAQAWLEDIRKAAEHDAAAFGRRRKLITKAGSLEYTIPEIDLRALLECAVDAGVTQNMALIALFAVVLSRWSGRRKVLFSVPLDTRTDPRWHQSIGAFVNSMPVLLDTGGNPSFVTLLKRTRGAILTVLQHAYVPPALIQAALAAGAPGSDLLHGVTLTVENEDDSEFRLGALQAVVRRTSPVTTAFGLSVDVVVGRSAAKVYVVNDRSVCTDDQAKRFGDQFVETILAAGTAETESDLPRLPSSDGQRLRAWCQGPVWNYNPGIIDRIVHWVRDRPHALAVQDRDRSLTYRQLWDAAGSHATRLRELGVGAEDVVAVCLPRSADLVTAILGVLRAGAAFMPLDPRNPATRTARQLTDMAAKVLIAKDPAIGGSWEGPVLAPGVLPSIGESSASEAWRRTDPDSMAYIIATSGSTGAPKGVMVTHRGLANYLRWAADEYGLGTGGPVPLHTSPAFDLAITSLLGPLYAGSQIHVLPERLGPIAVAEHFGDGYRMVKGTPGHLLAVLEEAAVRDTGPAPGVVVFGGEGWTAGNARRWVAHAPGAMLVNEYGPTETVVGSTAHIVTGPISSASVPIGRPIANTWVHVVDEDLEPVPVGVRGELVIGGAGVARGYCLAASLTAERFVPDPFGSVTGGRLYRTGDIAFWNDEGELELLGRGDDQVKILGYRVEPGEVEAALAQCPGIRQCAVVTDRRPERSRLVAYFVPEPVNEPGRDAIGPGQAADWLRRILPSHMIPDAFIPLSALPMGDSGKIDRSALLTPPEPSRKADPVTAVGGDSRWHAAVLAAWRSVLARETFADGATFFEAGGNSLMLLQLHAELIQRGVSGLSVTDLFRFPTVAGLADRIAEIGAGADDDERGEAKPAPLLVRRERLRRMESRSD